MKFVQAFTLASAGLVAAAPTVLINENTSEVDFALLMKRQNSDTSNQLSGPCRAVTFIFARGTTESGNLGPTLGPGVETGLQQFFGTNNVATQGVNYAAGLFGNLAPAGCDSTGVSNFASFLAQAATKCPNTKIVAGGYSQGAACLHAAFRQSSAATLSKVAAAFTFGDTRNEQDGGKYPNYPSSKSKIFCAPGDEVCDGTLIVSAAHLSYAVDIGPAVNFITSTVGPL